MFKRLSTKITLTIMIMAFLFMTISCIISYQLSKEFLVSEFSKNSVNITNQNIERLRMYCDMLEGNIDMIAKNKLVITTLSNDSYSVDVVGVLDSVINANENILGITIYGTKNKSIYYTNSVSIPPSYDEMVVNQIPKEFINSDEKICSIIRTDGLNGYYMSYRGKTNGVYTYIRKVFDNQNNGEVGYLIVDISLSSIFEFISNTDKHTPLLDVFIVDEIGNKYASLKNTKDSSKYMFSLNNESILKYDFSYIGTSSKLVNSNNQIVAFISLSILMEQLLSLLIKNVIIALLFLVLCFFGILILEKSIMIPIKDLEKDIKQNIMENKYEKHN